MMLIPHSVNSDWLFNTQARVRQPDWLIMEINEKATLYIDIPYHGTRPKSINQPAPEKQEDNSNINMPTFTNQTQSHDDR